MKNRKLATAMAAAMTLGAVAPVVANASEIAPLALPEATYGNLDARVASGYKLVSTTASSRTDIYNTNGTKDRADDTLKTEFKDAKIIIEKQNKENAYNDKFILATKAELADINIAKANIETAKAEIEAAQKAGAKVTKIETVSTFDGTDFVSGQVEVTVKAKNAAEKTYVFKGIDGEIDVPEVDANLEAIFTDLNTKLTTDVVASTITPDVAPAKWVIDVIATKDLDGKIDAATATKYADINRVKYTVEKNIAKFDVQKDEVNGNDDLKVTLLKKGTKNVVIELTFENFAKADKDLAMNIPASTDFTGHWAEAEIIEAMLQGQVDATGTYRPYDSITRAEFARIACSVFGIEAVEGQEEPFSDVKSNDWFYKYVVALYNTTNTAGVKTPIMQGAGDELFNPHGKITREEVAVMVAKLVDIDTIHDDVTKVNNTNIHIDTKTAFKDDAEIATWADGSAKFLNETKYDGDKVISQGNEGKFMPKSQISRAESLVMLGRAEMVPAP